MTPLVGTGPVRLGVRLTTQELKGLTLGAHAVQVEFVAIDHLPFRNRVIAALLFTVK